MKARFAPEDTILLSCRSGGRGAIAINMLATAGFTTVHNILDGMEGNTVDNPDSVFYGMRLKNGWKASAPWDYSLDPRQVWIPSGEELEALAARWMSDGDRIVSLSPAAEQGRRARRRARWRRLRYHHRCRTSARRARVCSETTGPAGSRGHHSLSDHEIDSRSAARTIGRLLIIAIAIGAVCGLATWTFLAVEHYGIVFLWETLPQMVDGVPTWAIPVAVVVVMTALAALIAALYGKRPFDMGEAEAEFDGEGRMGLPQRARRRRVLSSSRSFSGAAVGPEAPLTDINGGTGTFIAERLKLEARAGEDDDLRGCRRCVRGVSLEPRRWARSLPPSSISPSTTINRTTIVSGDSRARSRGLDGLRDARRSQESQRS